MMGTLSFSDPSMALFTSLLPLGATLPKKLLPPKLTRVSATNDNGGNNVLDKDFEFKTSFDDYLKAMESIKVERASNSISISRGGGDNLRKNSKAMKRIVEENEEESGEDKVSFHRKEIGRERVEAKGSKLVVERKKKERSDGSEDRHVGLEDRAAFRTFEEYGDDDISDKPRVSRVDMDERIQKLAKCLNGADIDMPEWKFSQMMRSAQIRFSDHSMLRIVQILGKMENWRRVLQVIEWIQSRERYKSHKIRYVYTAALDALGKARRPVEALNLFRAMQEQMASYPDIVAYRCIAVTLGQAGHMKELFDVIDTMRSPPRKKFKTGVLEKWDPRLEPDIIVYNSVLNACVRRQKWEGAFWVLQQLSEQGQQPTCTTYGLVMEVMLACGKYNLVHDFFRKAQKTHMPNALVYKVLVNTLWKEGKTDEAILAVEDMERRGIVGNAGLYYDLARCLCSAGRCQEALKQIDKICKVANKPLVVTYTGLIQACLESGDIESGAFIFEHMQKFCSPNLVTCNVMLKAFLDHGRFDEGRQLFLRLLENRNSIRCIEDYRVRVIPDIYTFNTMLDACVVEQKWDDLEFVYGQMLKYGHHFNAKRHLKPILDARRAGKVKLLKMVWDHLMDMERVPPPLLITEMFRMRMQQGDCGSALSCFMDYAPTAPQLSSRKYWSKFFTENTDTFDEGALHELVDKASIHLARSQNIALQYLMECCEEFLRTRRKSSVVEPAVDFQLMPV